jgi:phosphoribosylamine--glycine ligase
VFHAGTKLTDGKLVTNGGRVLGVTCKGNTLNEAINGAYQAVKKIHFENAHYRRDIGQKALKALFDPSEFEYKLDLEDYLEENGIYIRQ